MNTGTKIPLKELFQSLESHLKTLGNILPEIEIVFFRVNR